MPTHHERAVWADVECILKENPEFSATLFEYQRMMIVGDFPQDKIGIVTQKHWSKRTGRCLYDIYDAYCFALIHAGLCGGKIAGIDVNIECEPSGDKDKEANNKPLENLANMFDGQFYARFFGGYGAGDGHFGWKKPTQFGVGKYDKANDKIGRESIILNPREAVLEVGYTQASRTLLHLSHNRAVARWPYDSTYITAYVVLDDKWYNRHAWIEDAMERLVEIKKEGIVCPRK